MFALRKKCPYSELFWSAFFLHFPPRGKNADQNNSEYGHFFRSGGNTGINQKQKIVWCLLYSSPLKSSDFTSFYFLHRGGTATMLMLSKVPCCDLRHYKKQSPGGVLLRRYRSIFFNGPATLFKTGLWHRCCSANYTKFLRTFFLWSTTGGWFCIKLMLQSESLLFQNIS